MLVAAALAAFTTLPLAACELVNESFEFDIFGDFTLGDPPDTVDFTGGEAKSIGNFDLYRSGSHAWMISPGGTGTVTFESSAEQVDFFFRDENPTVASVLTLFGEGGEVLGVFNGTDLDWTQVTLSSDSPRIGSITLQNTGAGPGHTVIDDFSCTTSLGIDNPIPDPIPPAAIEIDVETVATGLTAPNWGTRRPVPGLLGSRRLVVSDQAGTLWDVDLTSGNKRALLDVSDRLVELGVAGPGTFDERGLLGVAFHPNFAENGLLYTYTSEPADVPADFPLPAGVDADHHSVITEWSIPSPLAPSAVVDPASDRVLMRIAQPQFNHDGGAVNFDSDGTLFISLGDGGGADDEGDGHSAGGNGQDPSNVLGTILRIDPLGSDSANGQYGVPADNPAVGAGPPFGGADGCTDGFCDEIWAYGLRNPFRFSFDRATGKMHIADVGQNDLEEINVGASGANYGWPIKEGTFCFDGNGAGAGFVDICDPEPQGLVDPVGQYDHDEGTAIIGGFVYRGSNVPRLRGRYLFGDFARTFALDGRIFALGQQGRINELLLSGGGGLNLFLLGFGQDAAGEIYVLANSTGVPFETTGVVLRITAAVP
jgi:glucose/arabinose dehydrogenase